MQYFMLVFVLPPGPSICVGFLGKMPTLYITVVSGSISWFLQTRIPNAWIGWLSKGLTIYIGSESLFHLKRFLQKETSSTAAASLSKTFQTLTVISGRMAETRRQDITTVTPNSATRTEATPTTILSRKTFTQDALSTVELGKTTAPTP